MAVVKWEGVWERETWGRVDILTLQSECSLLSVSWKDKLDIIPSPMTVFWGWSLSREDGLSILSLSALLQGLGVPDNGLVAELALVSLIAPFLFIDSGLSR